MDERDLERLLAGALDARARAEVGDDATPPPPAFADPGAGQGAHAHKRRAVRWLAPLAAAAAVVAVVVTVPALTGDGSHARRPHPGAAGTPTSAGSTPPEQHAGRKVHVSLLNADGREYGVGMPVIAYFSQRITDARAFDKATSVSVNGKPMRGAWYFEKSTNGRGPIEGHFRLHTYWPAHAKVRVSVPARGLSAGRGLRFADDVTVDFATGARTLATVDAARHLLTVTIDGKPIAQYPVSLGASSTPTESGVKVVMAKGSPVCMSGPGYHECNIKYTQRLTYTGEYLHAAPWNVANIKSGVNTSNGCTNLLPPDARELYGELEVGDPVLYPDADGPPMTVSQGYGDWNVPWKTWLTGGLVPTR